MKVNCFDFFCGAGGLTRGLLDAGIEVIAGFDCDEKCRDTYEKNNPGVIFNAKDIRNVTAVELRLLAKTDSFDEMLFAGCAPCQPFSPQRKVRDKNGNGEKKRVLDATLLSQFGRLVEECKPGMVLVENVPGIKRVPKFSTFRRFLRMLKKNGYSYAYDILDAKNFGVPQTRKRLILIAALGRDIEVCLPKQKYGRSLLPFKTVRQTISRFPALAAGESNARTPNHTAAAITQLNIERLKCTPHNGGDRRVWPEHLSLDCHKGSTAIYSDVYGRMSWDAPAPTLTGRCNSISNGRYGHPEQDRAISLREAAALQTFPNKYIFYGTKNHIALQIGNAVPVRLAKELGKHICSLRDSAGK